LQGRQSPTKKKKRANRQITLITVQTKGDSTIFSHGGRTGRVCHLRENSYEGEKEKALGVNARAGGTRGSKMLTLCHPDVSDAVCKKKTTEKRKA